jgi:hypothetical protein
MTISSTTARRTGRATHSVVFEAGYFIAHNVLIIRKSSSKVPADLGGDIYASLRDKNSIEPIERTLKLFIERHLTMDRRGCLGCCYISTTA